MVLYALSRLAFLASTCRGPRNIKDDKHTLLDKKKFYNSYRGVKFLALLDFLLITTAITIGIMALTPFAHKVLLIKAIHAKIAITFIVAGVNAAVVDIIIARYITKKKSQEEVNNYFNLENKLWDEVLFECNQSMSTTYDDFFETSASDYKMPEKYLKVAENIDLEAYAEFEKEQARNYLKNNNLEHLVNF